MNKAELVGKMAGKAGLTKKDAEKALVVLVPFWLMVFAMILVLHLLLM